MSNMALSMDGKINWQYRGEGNCSLAVANPKEQKVYRLVKNYYSQQLDLKDQSTSSKDIIKDELKKVIDYVENVMQPLLSSQFVELPVLCDIRDGLPKEAETMVNSSRPGDRTCKSQDNVDTSATTALVLPDFCFLPSCCPSSSLDPDSDDQPTISIEIKPKKGFLPQSQFINNTSLRHEVCKYCMHQRLKTREGRWPRTTNYCPLDLFSGNKQRMKHALLGLIHTPQNNLKICKNGVEIHGAPIQTDLSVILTDFFNNDCKYKYPSNFIDLVIEILSAQSKGDDSTDSNQCPSQVCYNSKYVQKSQESDNILPAACVLNKIYSLQSLDELDIDVIYPIYLTLQQHLSHYPQHRIDWGLDGPYTKDWLTNCQYDQHSQHLQSAVLRVKKFLISKTVQDCSIMIAIKPLTKRPSDMTSVISFHEQLFRYSISVIDLDPKRFDKIPTYFLMEQEMEEAYQENLDKMKIRDKLKNCNNV